METLRPDYTPPTIPDPNVHIYEENKTPKPNYLIYGLFVLVFLGSMAAGAYYFYSQNSSGGQSVPLEEEAQEVKRDIFAIENLAHIYEKNYAAELAKRTEEDYEPDPILSYPKELKGFLTNFETGVYKVGVTKLGAYPITPGSDELNYIGESSYGHYAYFQDGFLIRYDQDVTKFDFSEPIEPYSNTLITLHDRPSQKLSLIRPVQKNVTIFIAPYDRIIQNNEATLGIFYEAMNRLGNNNPIYKMEDKDYYLVQSGSKPGIIFHLDRKNSRIDSFYWVIKENRSETVRFYYLDATEEDLKYEIPADYSINDTSELESEPGTLP